MPALIKNPYDFMAMAQENINPEQVGPDGIPLFLANPNPVPMPNQPPKPSRNTISQFEDVHVKGDEPINLAPIPDYEAQITELYKKGLEQSQADVGSVRDQIAGLGERPSGFKTLDLTPLAGLVDSWTGSRLANSYNRPTADKEYDQKKALLQQALASGNDRLTDNKLNFLKMKADERKNEEAMRLREMMAGQQNENKRDRDETSLRKEYMNNPLYKQMGEINKAYEGILANPGSDGPQQQALVYQFSRILDPNSVVKESEYAMSAANLGKVSQARQFYDRMTKGELLTKDQIAKMKEASRLLIEAARSSLNAHNEYYRGLAIRKGVAPENVITDTFYGSTSRGGADASAKAAELAARIKKLEEVR